MEKQEKEHEDRMATVLTMLLEDRRREDERRDREQRRRAEEMREMREERQKDRALFEKILDGVAEKDDRAKQEERTERKTQRALSRLLKMKDSDDIERFCSSFETRLTALKIPEDEWKNALITSLSSKAEETISDLILQEDVTYFSIRDRLLETSGPTTAIATEKFFSLEAANIEDITVFFNTLVRWTDKMGGTSPEERKVNEKYCILRLQNLCNPEARRFLIDRKLTTISQVRQAVLDCIASNGSFRSMFKGSGNHQSCLEKGSRDPVTNVVRRATSRVNAE